MGGELGGRNWAYESTRKKSRNTLEFPYFQYRQYSAFKIEICQYVLPSELKKNCTFFFQITRLNNNAKMECKKKNRRSFLANQRRFDKKRSILEYIRCVAGDSR